MTLNIKNDGKTWVAAKRNISMPIRAHLVVRTGTFILVKFRFDCAVFCSKAFYTALMHGSSAHALCLAGEYLDTESFFKALDKALNKEIT